MSVVCPRRCRAIAWTAFGGFCERALAAKICPEQILSYTTYWRRLRDWTRDGAFQRSWVRLLRKLGAMRRLDRREALADGTFSPSKNCGGRGRHHQEGLRLEDHDLHGGSWSAGRGVGDSLESRRGHTDRTADCDAVIRRKLQRLLNDLAADSARLHYRLKRQMIELIFASPKPHEAQLSRKLRRYKRRWKIERSIGWLSNLRRLVVRFERCHDLFHWFIQLTCVFLIIRRF